MSKPTPANFWIRATMINVDNIDNVFGILRYSGAPEVEPTSPTTFPNPGNSKLLELSLVPLEDPGAPGLPVSGGVDRVFVRFCFKTT